MGLKRSLSGRSRVHSGVYIDMHLDIQTMNIHIYICAYVYIYIDIFLHTYTYVYVFAHVFLYVRNMGPHCWQGPSEPRNVDLVLGLA